jgi:hypothetical protein
MYVETLGIAAGLLPLWNAIATRRSRKRIAISGGEID